MPAAKYLDPATGQWKSLGTVGYDSTPIGGVITWTRKNLPTTGEYVMADGGSYSETVYPDAAKAAAEEVAAGNTLWGISGTAPNRTFTVPDLRDRFIYGAGTKLFGVRSQTNPALANPGEESHLLLTGEAAQKAIAATGPESQSHVHAMPANYVSDWTGGGNLGTAGNYNRNQSASSGANNQGHTHSITGSDAAAGHNNMPPYVVLGFIVKLKAVSVQGGVLQGPQGVAGGAYQTFVIGDGVAKSFVVNHMMGTEVSVAVRRTAAPRDEVLVDVEYTDPLNQVTIRTGDIAPAASELTVIVRAAGLGALNIAMDGWHVIGNPSEPAFQNSWVNSGVFANTVAGFRKFPDGRVRLRGTVKGGANGTILFNLPAGYRPPKDLGMSVPIAGGGSMGMLMVQASGDVWIFGAVAAGTNSYLDGCEFDTESVTQAAQLGAQPLDTWHKVGDPGEPALGAGVTHGSDQWLSFRKYSDGRVQLRGWCNCPTAAGSPLFTLPPGYRIPRDNLRFAVVDISGNHAYVYLQVGGAVIKQTAGITQICLDNITFDTETVAAYSAGIIGPPKVTALPASPVDGQECYFVADATNGILWHLRYNASSASLYKWEAVGASTSLYSAIATDQARAASGSLSDLATVGPSVVVPLARDYEYDATANGYPGAIATVAIYVASPPGTNQADDVAMFSNMASGQPVTVGATGKLLAQPAGREIRMQYVIGAGATGNYRWRKLAVRPVRVG